PCWQVEDFVVAQECARCSSFQAVSAGRGGAKGARPAPARPLIPPFHSQKTVEQCSPTGFIEKITCPSSRRDDCRSAVMEAHVFWRFVGTMMCVAAVFAVLVVCRQRVLDRKALEKVRKQIESI
ncbi:JTB protein, partial [Lophotis ruficrista]|nr:JTB protein [Lophotis ruficrista]